MHVYGVMNDVDMACDSIAVVPSVGHQDRNGVGIFLVTLLPEIDLVQFGRR
jgi:hypothetical protein